MERGTLVPAVRLDGYQAASLLSALQARGTPLALSLWERVYRAWAHRGIARVVAVPLNAREVQMLLKLGASTRLPGVVDYRYLAVYCHEDFPQQEVRVRSQDRPRKKRTFRIAGAGRKKFTRQKLYRIKTHQPKESDHMAAKSKSKTKKRNTKAAEAEAEDDDELEGLEELEDLEDEDVEEPDEDESDDDEDEEPAPKKSKKKATAKKGKSKKSTKSKKSKKVVDEDEDDDEEDEAPKKKAKSTKKAKAGKKGASKGGSAGKSTKELTGGVGTAELAEAAAEIAEVDIDGRDVRVYLRSNSIEKDPEHGRYYWPSVNNKEFKKLAKAIAKEFED